MILEFLLYYMTKPQYQIHVREHIYLDNMLDLSSNHKVIFDYLFKSSYMPV